MSGPTQSRNVASITIPTKRPIEGKKFCDAEEGVCTGVDWLVVAEGEVGRAELPATDVVLACFGDAVIVSLEAPVLRAACEVTDLVSERSLLKLPQFRRVALLWCTTIERLPKKAPMPSLVEA